MQTSNGGQEIKWRTLSSSTKKYIYILTKEGNWEKEIGNNCINVYSVHVYPANISLDLDHVGYVNMNKTDFANTANFGCCTNESKIIKWTNPNKQQ